jgi:hypothetical protein
MTRTLLLYSTLAIFALGLAQAPAALAQNTTPTAQVGPNGEVPAPDKHPTPPLTFPPSSACAFHGNANCEAKIKKDAVENKKFGSTGVKGGAQPIAPTTAFGSSGTPSVSPIGGMSSGESSTLNPSASPNTTSSTASPGSIGNPAAGTPNPSGTGSGASVRPSSGGSVGGSVPMNSGSGSVGSSTGNSGGL